MAVVFLVPRTHWVREPKKTGRRKTEEQKQDERERRKQQKTEQQIQERGNGIRSECAKGAKRSRSRVHNKRRTFWKGQREGWCLSNRSRLEIISRSAQAQHPAHRMMVGLARDHALEQSQQTS